MKFTNLEKKMLYLLSEFRNYDDLETELNDNAVGLYMKDIVEYTDMTAEVARGVVSSLVQKDILYTDDVNGKPFYRATDECLKYLYETLDKE